MLVFMLENEHMLVFEHKITTNNIVNIRRNLKY
jgi:hypothetical protein